MQFGYEQLDVDQVAMRYAAYDSVDNDNDNDNDNGNDAKGIP